MKNLLTKQFEKLFPKKFHWYEVKYTYLDKNGRWSFTFTIQIGLSKRKEILDSRKIKKVLQPLHKLKFVNKDLLKNGTLNTEVLCYLGYLQKRK